MKTEPLDQKNQQGIAHLLGLVLLLFVVAVIGFGGYQVYNNGKEDTDSSLSTEASDLPIVQEGEDKTGEILPPADDTPEEPVDIDGNDPKQTGVQ